MKIIHTADLHFGQVLYQNYTREDEHRYFFAQLKDWCREYRPDALLFSGDIFDIQQPGAAVKEAFTHYFVDLHDSSPEMKIIMTAGNHDSASRLQAESEVWQRVSVHIAGVPPSMDSIFREDGWQDRYIVEMESGFVAAIPFMQGKRKEVFQSVLNRISTRNKGGKPVVMMAHSAVSDSDMTGHGFEIGTVMTQDLSEFGSGYDYLALGHIHRPQTIGHREDFLEEQVSYPCGVARYSGSPLHVSCDENFPHSVSLVEISGHLSQVAIRQLYVNQLRRFYVLPSDGSSFTDADKAISSVRDFSSGDGGYFRLKFRYGTPLPSNFSQLIYDALSANADSARYNPKIVWDGVPDTEEEDRDKPVFEVADLQQMTDPHQFIIETIDDYPDIDRDFLAEAFELVRQEVASCEEESASKGKGQKSKSDRV